MQENQKMRVHTMEMAVRFGRMIVCAFTPSDTQRAAAILAPQARFSVPRLSRLLAGHDIEFH